MREIRGDGREGVMEGFKRSAEGKKKKKQAENVFQGLFALARLISCCFEC